MAKLRLFEVPPATPKDPRPSAVEVDGPIVIAASGEAAKTAAYALLRAHGYNVRSMNWGPDSNPTKPPVLIAYVAKKVA